jgi:hypothetical protein
MASESNPVTTAGHQTDDDTRSTRSLPRRARLVLLVAALLVVCTIGGASAAALITGRQIKDGTVTGRDIRDHSLRSKDVKAGVVRPGLPGPAGPAGAPGPQGGVGPPGRNGLGGLTTAVSPDALTVVGGGSGESAVACPTGLSALGGGAAAANATEARNMVFLRSLPVVSPDGHPFEWAVTVLNLGSIDIHVFVWAQCAPI